MVGFARDELFAVEQGLGEEIAGAEDGVAGEFIGDAFSCDGGVEFHDPCTIGGDYSDHIFSLKGSENAVPHLSFGGEVQLAARGFGMSAFLWF